MKGRNFLQKKIKDSLLLLTLIFVLVISVSSIYAEDLDNSTNDLAVYNDDDSISIENQDDGYNDVSVISDENESSYADGGIAAESNDDKLGYATSTSSAYIKFDQEDYTITEGESVTITGSLVDSRGNNPGGPDFPLAVYINGHFSGYKDLNSHRITYTVDSSKLVASDTPYKISFVAEEGPEYSGEYLEGFGGPEVADSWVFITVNSNTTEPETLTEAYVDYVNGDDANNGASAETAFKTIGHALSAVEDNAIIHIADGVNYLDDVDVNGLEVLKNVTIIGMGSNSVIDARNSGRIFKITANQVALSNLIFRNANAASTSDKRGSALWVSGTTLTINNCQFINNTAGPSGSYGGAINLKATSTTIKNSIFDGNSAFYTSGGINAESGNALLNISNTVFTNNAVLSTGWANGAAICAYGQVIIDRSTFYNNQLVEGKNGRSINQYDGNLIITNSILLDGSNSVYLKVPTDTTLANNWWGNNDTSKDLTPKDLGYTNADVESYLYLNLSTSASNFEVGKPVTIDIKFIPQTTANLADVEAIVSSEDGTFDEYTVNLVNGIGDVAFTSTKEGLNSISVNVLGITDEIELTFEEAYPVGQLVDKMVELDSGVVSGNVDYVAVNPWSSSSQLVYVIPENVTNIKSVIVIINDYSGSGSQSYGLYSNVTLNTTNGLEVLAFDTLRMDGFPSFSNDPNVYGVNRHTTRQYSDYQLVFDITDKVSNLNPGDKINIGVTNTKISDLQFDGRIKLISLLFAYDDGDEDNYTYWFNVGQLWTQGSESFNIDTSGYSGKDNNITITSVGLSSQIGAFKINNVNAQPDSAVGGNYYLYMKWDNIAPIFNKGQDTSFFFTCSDQGLYTPSFKANVILLVATELENEPVLTEVYVDYAKGSDSYLGTTASAPFKTIAHALSVVGDNAIIHVADGVNYLDDADVNGLNILKNVTIIGMGNNVVIDARNAGRIFKINADQVALSNLIFTNANTASASDKRGAALWVNGTTLTIDNCQFINNTAGPSSSYGGAITLKASNTTISNSQFDGNTAYYTGAAVNAEKGNIYLAIDNCVFMNNQVTNVASNWANGAGICAYETTVIRNSIFFNNTAKNGKSVYKYAGDLIIEDSIILDGINSVFIYNASATQTQLKNNWWGNNDTTKDSTPKDLGYTNVDVESYLYLNLTMYSKGLDVGDVATVNINLFTNEGVNTNVMDLPVTFVAVNGTLNKDSITLVNGRDGEVEYTITGVGNNSVTVDILGIKETISLTPECVISTEVVYVDYEHGSNSNSGTSWDNAVKTIEKAMKLVDNNGIIYVANGVVYLADSTPAAGIAINKNVNIIGESINAVISGNNAKRIFNVNNGYTLTICNLTLTEGYSTAQGGAIFVANGGAINISDSVISNSRANSAGGAIGATQGYINNINNVTFINNYAGNMGGAIGISSGSATNSAITIGDNNKFINNSASNVGSAIGSGNPPITIGKNNLFDSNKGLTSNGKGTVGSNKISLGTGNVFINNYAAQGGALFAHYNSGSATGSYCFFINNTDASGYTLRQYGNKANSFTLENCYWGTNTPDFNTIFNKAFYHNAYLVLDVSPDKTEVPLGDSAVITIDITKNQNNQLVDVDSLPANVPLTFTVVNGNVAPESAVLVKGIASTTYTPQSFGDGSVTVNLYSVAETVNFTAPCPDVEISSVTTQWSNGIFAGVNNTFTVKLTNNDGIDVENLVLEVYSNETGELLANYTIDSLATGATSIALTDSTLRPITEETVWPEAQNHKIKFTFNLKYAGEIISTVSADKILAYNGYFNQSYAYGGHDNIINRNYTINGDIIVATHDASYYADQFTRFRNETWNIETPEGAEIVKVLLYFAYNWDTSYYPNGWNLTFNNRDILNQNISYEMDRGNLGYYGSYNYGLVVFDVTELYNVNDINSFVINKTGNCALYPSTLFVLYNVTDSDSIIDVYFSDVCDVFYPYYNKLGYDELLKTVINFNDIDLTNLDSATLYAFGGSGGYNDADLSFNDLYVSDAYPSSSDKECCPYIFNVTSGISQNNVAMFITSPSSSTVVAYQQVLVVSKKLTPTAISTDIVNGSEIFVGDNLDVAVSVDPKVNGTYSLWIDGVLITDYGVLTVVDGEGSFIILAEDLTIGDHNITVQFDGNGYYKASENATYAITVSKVTNYEMLLDAGNSTPLGSAINITVTLPTDANGGTVFVSIDGVNYTATVVDGSAVIVGPDNLASGNYTFTVTYTGDEKYASIDNITTVSIAESAEVVIGANYTVSALDDGFAVHIIINTDPAITGNLTVKFNGNEYPVEVVNGTANFTSMKVYSNNYTTDIIYPGSEIYKNSSTTINAVVKASKVSRVNDFNFYYYNNDMGSDSEKGISIIKVVDTDGNPIKKATVTITIMDRYKLKVKTDANGIAKFTKAYKPGTYTVTATHDNKVTKLGNLVLKSVVNVPKVTTVKKSAKSTTLKITLKGTGPIKGKTVVVNFMKKNYRVTTNSNGVALFKFTPDMVAKLGVGKTYKVRVTYRMDSVAQSIKIAK